MLTESTYKGLSGVRGNSHAPFLGGGGAAMCRCYPTRQTGQHCSSQNQSRKKKRIITGKVMSFLTTGHKQRRRGKRTGAQARVLPRSRRETAFLAVWLFMPAQCQQGERGHRRTSSPFIKALQCSQTSIIPEKAGLRPPPGCYLPPDS